jgi:hypothetical protein
MTLGRLKPYRIRILEYKRLKFPNLHTFLAPFLILVIGGWGGSFCAVLLPIFLCEVGGGVDLIPEFIDLALHIN